MMATTRKQAVKKSISHFFTDLRRVDIQLRGKDLKKMGLKPGPIYRQVLENILNARLDGKIKTRKDEIDFVRQFIKDP
jgi:tRNA nucleotidyltransferase (CCA-adding enzyme)